MKHLSLRFAQFWKQVYLNGALLVVYHIFFSSSIIAQSIPEEILQKINTSSVVSIVFATENFRTPISSFGHSFLVFHKKDNYPTPSDIAFEFVFDNSKSYHLITSLISYAPGFYKAQYFINKEKEYSNENRNLWVIPVKTSPKELLKLKKITTDKLKKKDKYNFFKANCSSYIYDLINQSLETPCLSRSFYTIPEESLHWLKKCDRLSPKSYLRKSSYQVYKDNHFKNEQQKQSLELNLRIPHESSMIQRDQYFKKKKHLKTAAPNFIQKKNVLPYIEPKTILDLTHTQNNLTKIGFQVALRSEQRKSRQLFPNELSIAKVQLSYQNTKLAKQKIRLNSLYLFTLSSEVSSSSFFRGFTRKLSLGYEEYNRLIPHFSFTSFQFATGKTLDIHKRIKFSALIGNQTGLTKIQGKTKLEAPFIISAKISLRLSDFLISYERDHFLDNAFILQDTDKANIYFYSTPRLSFSTQWQQINRVSEWSGKISWGF